MMQTAAMNESNSTSPGVRFREYDPSHDTFPPRPTTDCVRHAPCNRFMTNRKKKLITVLNSPIAAE